MTAIPSSADALGNSIEVTLQQAITFHKEGRLQDAENLYRLILQSHPRHPDANHNLGVLAINVNQSKAALPFLRTALDANPKQSQYWLSYIDALIYANEPEQACQVITDARQINPDTGFVRQLEQRLEVARQNMSGAPSLYASVISLREAGSYREAIVLLEQWLLEHSKDAQALALLAHNFLLNKQDEKAKEAIASAIEVAPMLPIVQRNKARLLLKQQDFITALSAAKVAYESEQQNIEGWLILASALSANNQNDQALRLLEQALQARPDYAEAYASRAILRLRKNDISGALGDAERALLLKPHLLQLWGIVGNLRYQLNDLTGAITALTEGLKLEPENVEHRVNLGEFLRQSNQIELAITVLKEAVSYAPGSAIAWSNLGTALQSAGQKKEAKDAYTRSLSIDPLSAEIASNLGALAKEEENWEEAARYFEQALSIQPTRADFMASIAASLIGLRDYKNAESFLKKVLEKDFKNFNAIFLMSIVVENYGNVKEAEEKLLTVIKSKPEFIQAYINLATLLICSGRLIEAKEILSAGLQKIEKSHWRLASQLLVVCFLLRSYDEANKIQIKYSNSIDFVKKSENIQRIFFNYLSALLISQGNIDEFSQTPSIKSELVVIGDSHSLSPGNQQFTWIEGEVVASSRLIFGVKMFHLNCDVNNNFIYYLSEQLSSVHDGSHLLFTIGEIDCRPDEGIWRAVSSKPLNLLAIISNTVEKYLDCIESKVKSRQFASITVQGVPAPAYSLIGRRDPGDKEAFKTMIKTVNETLKAGVNLKGWFFLDVYAATVGVDGCSNSEWHLDQNHLNPLFYSQAKRWIV